MFHNKCCAQAQLRPRITDFVHKLRIVLKELNETGIWLQMIAKTSMIPTDEIVAIVAENQELSRIIAASVRTARGNG